MSLVRHDDGLSELLADDVWATVAEGFDFTEGPIWHPDGYLLFSDIPNSRIHKWADGEVSIYREPSGQSNGLTLDLDLNLLACEHENRRVSRQQSGGGVEAVATHFEGRRLNSPNDIVVRSDDRIFFTDPPYGIREEQRELPFNGVFTLTSGADLTLLVDDFDRPNGLALSPDERVLYAADTARHHVRAFDVAADGTLSGGRIFAEMREKGRPDGMKVDRDGRLYVAAGTIQVFAADGRPLGVIDCPQPPANCAWGTSGAGTLFITARTGVYSLGFSVRGVGPGLS